MCLDFVLFSFVEFCVRTKTIFWPHSVKRINAPRSAMVPKHALLIKSDFYSRTFKPSQKGTFDIKLRFCNLIIS